MRIDYIAPEHLTGIIPLQIKAPKSVDSRLPVECSTTDGGAVMSSKVKEIKLTKGKFALVDDSDFDWLNQWKWQAAKGRSTYYAQRYVVINGKQSICQMHRIILDAPKRLQGDHINGNGLDNRRRNLRLCTNAQNSYNKRKQKSKNKYKRVRMSGQKWRAEIKIQGKLIYLGTFETPELAARAYDVAALKYFGKFARTNKSLDLI